MLNIDIKELIERAKREISEDLIFQDREYYQEPMQVWQAIYNSKKRQFDLGKLVNNLDTIIYQDPKNNIKKKDIFRYFIAVIDAEKHHLNYRRFRTDIIHRYRDLAYYI